MSWLITGSEILLQWNGGMTCGLMKVLLITSVIFVLRRLSTTSKLSIMNQPWRPSLPEKVGATTKIKWLRPIQSEVLLPTPKLLTRYSMELLTQKEHPQWNNLLSWCQRKNSQKPLLNISISLNGKMLLWMILSMWWKIILKRKILPWQNGESFGCKRPVATRSSLCGIQKTKVKRLNWKLDRHAC